MGGTSQPVPSLLRLPLKYGRRSQQEIIFAFLRSPPISCSRCLQHETHSRPVPICVSPGWAFFTAFCYRPPG